jgi:translation initiation factor 2B subunit (eIF-2B alpha/beta/delta family)
MNHSDAFAAELLCLQRDRSSGAAQLARQALLVVVRELQVQLRMLGDPRAVFAVLVGRVQLVRPSMAAIIGLTEQWRSQCLELPSGLAGEVWLQQAQVLAQRLVRRSEQAPENIAAHLQKLLRGNEVILTHSYSSTLLMVLYHCRNLPLEIICSEARPLNEGVAMAKALRDMGFATTLITDAQVAIALQDADLFMCGADTVLEDGSVINKVGTWPTACVARSLDKPVWVVSETFKKLPARFPLPSLEEMAVDELGYGELPGICVKNVYFDRTPADLITRWVNECGVPGSKKQVKLADENGI